MMIKLLCDHPEAIRTLAQWYESEWQPYYGREGRGDARSDLQSRCNRDELPIGMVAIEGRQVYGTIALDLDVSTGLTPSVVGLLVHPDHRRRGIASSLLDAAENMARRLGCSQLFVSTTILGPHLRRKGWSAQGTIDFLNGGHGSVYVRELD